MVAVIAMIRVMAGVIFHSQFGIFAALKDFCSRSNNRGYNQFVTLKFSVNESSFN